MPDQREPDPTSRTDAIDASLRALGREVDDALKDGAMRCGPYVLIEQLGEGGYGVVFAAVRDDAVGRRVAVKVLKRGLDTDDILRRFEMEQRALSRIDHPCVAAILDAGVTGDGRPWFAMPLLDGDALTVACDEASVPLADRVQLMALVCDAVQAAHVQGIVHRDLKPGNVLVVRAPGGTLMPKVIDFGVAKAIDPDESSGATRTEHHRRLGTPAYMAPEQLSATASGADVRSDVFALGVILAELASGVRPSAPADPGHDGRLPMRPSRMARSQALVDATAADGAAHHRGCASARDLVRRLEGDIDAIVAKATMPEPECRYQSAEAMAEDLRRMARSEPVLAREPSRSYLVARFVQRHRRGVVSAALVAIALLSVSAVAMSSAARAERSASRASQNARRAEQVADMLRGVFARIDPEVAQGRDRTLLTDLLDGTLERLRGGADTLDPQAAAEVARIVAEALVKLERPGIAIVALQDALDRLDSAIGLELDPETRRALRIERAALRVDLGTAIFEASWADAGVTRVRLEEPLAAAQWRAALDELAAIDALDQRIAILARMRLWRIREFWPESTTPEAFDSEIEADIERGPFDEVERWSFRLRKAENNPWRRVLREHPPIVASCAAALGDLHPLVVRARNRSLSFEVMAAITSRAEPTNEANGIWPTDELLAEQWRKAAALADQVVAQAAEVYGPLHTQTLSARMWQLAAHGHLSGAGASEERYRALRSDVLSARGPDSPMLRQVDMTWQGITKGYAAGKWW